VYKKCAIKLENMKLKNKKHFMNIRRKKIIIDIE